MSNGYRLICMSFDGEYQTEYAGRGDELFPTISDAWEYSNDLGSRWYFYPFHFVVSASGKTIADTPDEMDNLKGLRVKTVVRIFNALSKESDMQNADAELFGLTVGAMEIV